MTPLHLYARFRSDVVDVVEPFLWSADEVYGYMDDAQGMLCRLTDGIRDSSSEAAQAQVSAGEPWVEIHPAVLRIRSISLASTGKDIRLLSYGDVAGADKMNYPFPATNEMNLTGNVLVAIVDMEDGKLRLVRIPAADDTLNLIVERLPLCEISKRNVPDRFEVRQEHHLHLLLWMKHLAYAKQDAETFNEAKSREFQAAFVAYCDQAKLEKARRNQTPRLMAYGGL